VPSCIDSRSILTENSSPRTFQSFYFLFILTIALTFYERERSSVEICSFANAAIIFLPLFCKMISLGRLRIAACWSLVSALATWNPRARTVPIDPGSGAKSL